MIDQKTYNEILQRVWEKICARLDIDMCQTRLLKAIDFDILKN
jgi:hypothetical protein